MYRNAVVSLVKTIMREAQAARAGSPRPQYQQQEYDDHS
jgi:hypothetical protein